MLTLVATAMCLVPAAGRGPEVLPRRSAAARTAAVARTRSGRRNLSVLLEAVSATFGRPGERQPGKQVIAAQGVSTLGEVLDGPWYMNRHGRTRMTLEELRRGSGDDQPPAATGAWHVLLLKNTGLQPTLVFRDDNNRVYLLRLDPRGAPELATGAEMISSRFFHALGYYVPETYLTVFARERLVVETNATAVTSNADVRPLVPEHIDRLLEAVARRTDGHYRAVALRVPTDGVSLVGPYQLFGTRSDDPNDVIPHEHRRELRGLQVFSAWLNHARMDALHTFDIVVQPAGEPPHIRHYLFDFMATLGSGLNGPKAVWEGRDPIYAQGAAIRNISALGVYTPAWMRAKYPDLPAVGSFDSLTFEPDKWANVYDIAPFANRLPDDAFWAARQVAAFTDDDIRAIVRGRPVLGPEGRTLDRGLPDRSARPHCSHVLCEGASARRYRRPRRRAQRSSISPWSTSSRRRAVPDGLADLRQQGGKPSTVLGIEQRRISRYRRRPSALRPEATSWRASRRRAHLRAWPSASSCAERRTAYASSASIASGPAVRWSIRASSCARFRNRYVELEPERQRLFDTYARAMNVRLGENLTPEERFRALSPSEQTTFDGVTHALLHSPLTDDRGQPLGRAIDLVASIERIAGEQAGRSGDQQFRIYVTLRPNAPRSAGAVARVRAESREHGVPCGLSALVPPGRRRPECRSSRWPKTDSAPTSTSTIAPARHPSRCSTAISRHRIRTFAQVTTRNGTRSAGTASPTGGRRCSAPSGSAAG